MGLKNIQKKALAALMIMALLLFVPPMSVFGETYTEYVQIGQFKYGFPIDDDDD